MANTSATVNNRRKLNSMYGLSAASPVYSNVYNIQSNQGSNYNGLQPLLNSASRIASAPEEAIPGAIPSQQQPGRNLAQQHHAGLQLPVS